MPYDEHMPSGGGDGDEESHTDLEEFSEFLADGVGMLSETNGKCNFCVQPYLIKELIYRFFVIGQDHGIMIEDTMKVVEAAANTARSQAIVAIAKEAQGIRPDEGEDKAEG